MNKAAKKRWVTALRSGDYKQGFDAMLADDGTFCPLGVLCDIEIDGDWEPDDRAPGLLWKIHGAFMFPPVGLRMRLGLISSAMNMVSRLNDAAKLSFPQIADHIEREL